MAPAALWQVDSHSWRLPGLAVAVGMGCVNRIFRSNPGFPAQMGSFENWYIHQVTISMGNMMINRLTKLGVASDKPELLFRATQMCLLSAQQFLGIYWLNIEMVVCSQDFGAQLLKVGKNGTN